MSKYKEELQNNIKKYKKDNENVYVLIKEIIALKSEYIRYCPRFGNEYSLNKFLLEYISNTKLIERILEIVENNEKIEENKK